MNQPETMALARAVELPGHTLHAIVRGRARAPCYSCPADREAYLGELRRQACASGCALHAYVLMGNHVHLLVTPWHKGGVSALLGALADGYARHVREAYGHEEPLWDEQVELRPVFPRRDLLGCMRYIELNPVRARLVARPEDYRWSSYRVNALGESDPAITPHAHYCTLGRTADARLAAYRAIVAGGESLLAVSRMDCGESAARRPFARAADWRRTE